MRTSWVVSAAAAFWMVVFTGSAALAGAHPAAAGAAGSAGGAWRTAHEVRGLAALNAGGDAQVLSVSCASAGNCAAGGYYENARPFYEAFVVSEVNGTWGRAAEVPGIAALNTGADAWVTSVSCASAGNCTAGGFYAVASVDGDLLQAFAATEEVRGTWRTARALPFPAGIGLVYSLISSLSCTSPDNCSAGGFYSDISGHDQAFVASEVAGTWHAAVEVPGTAGLNAGGHAQVNSVSCGSPDNCSAGGFYSDISGHGQGFIANRT